jgi:hypothetical protein
MQWHLTGFPKENIKNHIVVHFSNKDILTKCKKFGSPSILMNKVPDGI